MKHVSDYDNIFEIEAWNFWANMKLLSGHLNWGLDIKGPYSDPVGKTFLGLRTVDKVSKWWNFFLKMW